jgi:hypothetical protein
LSTVDVAYVAVAATLDTTAGVALHPAAHPQTRPPPPSLALNLPLLL